MKKITITTEYEIYDFNELPPDAKSRAINDILMSITDVPELYPELEEEINKAQDKSEKMYTPWFFATYLWEFAEEKILKILQQSVYLKDGAFFDERDKYFVKKDLKEDIFKDSKAMSIHDISENCDYWISEAMKQLIKDNIDILLNGEIIHNVLMEGKLKQLFLSSMGKLTLKNE